MKTILAGVLVASLALVASAADAPLVPDGVNQVLGRIAPDMAEAKVEGIVKKYYPDAKRTGGPWSGQTGYVQFKLSERYSISIAEYKDPKDFESRFVHADMLLYVYDWELKRRINISFHKWDQDEKDGGKTSEQPAGRDAVNRAPQP
jgi:hypothetical protein